MAELTIKDLDETSYNASNVFAKHICPSGQYTLLMAPHV